MQDDASFMWVIVAYVQDAKAAMWDVATYDLKPTGKDEELRRRIRTKNREKDKETRLCRSTAYEKEKKVRSNPENIIPG